MQHEIALSHCIQLATRGRGAVSPNPMVGAVLVYQNKIIGSGWHTQFGAAHAEVEAVKSVEKADLQFLSKSILYVTLEPCCHTGKTPPCVDLILLHNIPKVVIGCLDPNPMVAGQGVLRLREAGVEVLVGVCEADCQALIAPFRHNIVTQTPYIILKFAQTADGFLGMQDRQRWITSDLSARTTHAWRAEADAILIGANTARLDNPSLTTRFVSGKNALRIVLAGKTELPAHLKVFDGQTPTLIVAQNTRPYHHLPVQCLSFTLENTSDWLRFFTLLYKQYNIGILMVEGGATLLQTLVDNALWQEARVLRSKKSWGDGDILAPQLPIDASDSLVLPEETVYWHFKK